MDELVPYMRAHPLYFVDESYERDTTRRFIAELPGSWQLHSGFHWTSCFAPNQTLLRQGWKIHVSAVMKNAQEILEIVTSECIPLSVSFKFLPSEKRLHARNSISCPREHAGKFITCYPSESQLGTLLERLEKRLSKFDGPYILSDRRWDKAPIYLRYGSFRPDDGQDIDTAIYLHTPSGERETDTRSVGFEVPSWAAIPGVLAPWLEREEDSESDVDTLPFDITSAIQFSNSGGTYRGTAQGRAAIIKEGRPHAGWDERNRDAVARLIDHAAVLEELSGKVPVPAIFWSGLLWEHYFVAIESMPGKPLNQWVTDNYPGYVADGETLPRYFRDATTVLNNLVQAVTNMHGEGWAHLDLHPRNVLVADDLTVGLIDLECARRVTDELFIHDIAAPGFRAPGKCTPEEIDRYCLAQFTAYLLSPAVELSDLVPDYREQVLDFAPGQLLQDRAQASSSKEMESVGQFVEHARTAITSLAPIPSHGVEARQGLRRRFLIANEMPLADLPSQLAKGTQSMRDMVPKRSYPVHPYGLQQPNRGLAYGDFTIDVLTRSRSESNQPEVPTPEFNLPGAPVGLFTGEIGDLIMNDILRGPAATDEHLQHNAGRWLSAPGKRVYDGRPGVLLGLAHLLANRPELDTSARRNRILGESLRIAAEYRSDPARFAPLGADRPMLGNHPDNQNSGLFYGHLGIAWLATALQRLAPDEAWVELVQHSLKNELGGYVFDDRYETLQLRQGHRQLPYLSMGSAGFGVVINEWDRTDLPEEIISKAPALYQATAGTMSMFPGLFNGYSGLLVGRAGLARFIDASPVTTEHLENALNLYLLASDSGLHVAGDAGVRLTTDVASGSAGLILAHDSLSRSDCQILPRPARESTTPISAIKSLVSSSTGHRPNFG
ncbi:protein kinase/lanthionine synthetase C family protein [Leucobacter viscericola]|uniref:Protein kinase/lanthionine synthetase C family protein n=1 Tax=Leucobacter viscericola TaxID=2714935 RepID=A0A6G7XFW9_9MICO|nr:class III lanthionine synthetase LanKC [Leucobacter viscericola]QIK63455.1 protein kinase/lanthionine synthetase C family protein [Leucobacter viscericola]